MFGLRPRYVAILATLVVTAFLAAGVSAGLLADAYTVLWTSTTGEMWTFIMRRNPWLLPLVALPVLSLLAWRLPRRYWGRVVLIDVVAAVAFLAGHVYWGGS